MTVTVIIPTIGRPELRRAVDSARAQTVPCTVIVVLDAPDREDAVRDMVGDVVVVVTSGRIGGAAARNAGLDVTTSEYVAFLDDDDWWEADKLAQQLEMMAVTRANLCFTAVDFVDGDTRRVLPEAPFEPAAESMASYLVRRPHLRHGYGYLQSSTLLAETALAQRVRWDGTLPKHQDWDFVVRLMEDGEVVFAFCGAPLVHVQKGSASSISASRNRRASEQWLERHFSRLDRGARGDFVATQVLRSSLAMGDGAGVLASMKLLRRSRPSPAAVVVGLFGLVEWARR